MTWILFFLIMSWIAIFTSQSLIDLLDVAMTLTALFIAYKNQEIKRLFTNFRPAWLWPLWLSIILIGLFLNTNLQSAKAWEDFFEFRWILTFLCMIYLFKHLRNQQKAFNILAVITIVLNVIAFFLWLKTTYARAGGLLGASMSFAHNLAPVLCLYTILTLTNWKRFILKEKILYAAVVFTSAAIVVLTFARGVWIGSVVALLTTTFLWNRKIFVGLISALLVLVLIGISTNERFANRVLTKTADETNSNQERTALWRGNWEMVKEHPLFGVGLGANKSHLRRHYDTFGYPETQRKSHAHNQYLQYWAGTGTFGLICFLSFLFIVLKYSYQSYKKIDDPFIRSVQLALLAGLICFLVGAFTESNFNIAKNRFLFLILAAMAIAWSSSNDEVLKPKDKNWD